MFTLINEIKILSQNIFLKIKSFTHQKESIEALKDEREKLKKQKSDFEKEVILKGKKIEDLEDHFSFSIKNFPLYFLRKNAYS